MKPFNNSIPRARAQKIAGAEPNYYLFSACENGNIDPATPQKSWRSAWRSLRKAAGLRHLRFHDLRHHAITELAESDASEQTIMSVAGHVSRQMLEHYSHVRMEAKRRAVEMLSQSGKASGYVTNHVTRGVRDDLQESVTERKEWSALADDFRTFIADATWPLPFVGFLCAGFRMSV